MEAIQALMGKFSQRAFITRKSYGSTLQIFSDIEESVSKQHILISSTGEQIHKLLEVFSTDPTLHKAADYQLYQSSHVVFLFDDCVLSSC